MKLSELGLKSKPQTKYFENGYIAFSVRDGELNFRIIALDKARTPFILADYKPIKSLEHYTQLISFKSIGEIILE